MEAKRGPAGTRRLYGASVALWAALVLVGALFCFAPLYQNGFEALTAEPIDLTQALRVNINQADRDTLCLLPGVGEKKAQKIWEYRQQYGPFLRLEDVANVEGIGPKTLESWQGIAYVG